MEQGIRSSMNLLHTWAGVIVGALLFAIFWMGTLSVFDREIDRWMAPTTRIALPDKPASFDAFRKTYDAAVAVGARSWTMLQPSERQPVVRIVYRDGPEVLSLYYDPVTGAPLETGTWAGSRFFYPFHHELHLKIWDIGEWITGAAAMVMLLLCVSGVIIHRKLIAEFFMLRTRERSARMTLDLHTVAGVLGLPFNFIIALSGLIIMSIVFFPSGWQATYSNKKSFNEEAYSAYSRPMAKKPGNRLMSLDALAAKAKQMWGGAEPWAIVVQYPGDANAYVSVFQSFDLGIVRAAPAIHFDAATGAVLHQSGEMKPLAKAQRFISGMHQIQFRHWTLRALYFALGLLGCVLILSGFQVWLQARRRRHAAEGRSGVRIVEAVAVGSVTGIIAASVGFMVINRILPLGISFMGIPRYALEIWVFYLVWLATFAHAWWRPRAAWAGQCRAVAALAVLAVILNWVTTGDHLLRSLAVSRLWPVAGVDIGLLALASAVFVVSRWLSRAEQPAGQAASDLSRAGSHA